MSTGVFYQTVIFQWYLEGNEEVFISSYKQIFCLFPTLYYSQPMNKKEHHKFLVLAEGEDVFETKSLLIIHN